MIAVDTSAVFAILNAEPDAPTYVRCLLDQDKRVMSSASLVELGSICINRLAVGTTAMDRLLRELSISVVDFDGDQAFIAIEAYRRFGKGRGHRAGLNLGDCFSYALAKALDAPLLYKGDDFIHTDIRSAIDA